MENNDRIQRTLRYYDIFQYPLSEREVHTFSPGSCTLETTRNALQQECRKRAVFESHGYFSIRMNVRELVTRRKRMERYAQRHWVVARIMTHIIKRCPFVSCVLITGTLSKNLSAPDLDIDYFIITKPDRLWIARSLLTLFKKLVLLDSKKYFCLNYFISEDALEIEDKNIFTATEIVYTKVLYNATLHQRFLAHNTWIAGLFPNWTFTDMLRVPTNDRMSFLRKLFELPFSGRFGTLCDNWLMNYWSRVWKRRYASLDDAKRDALFRVRKTCSKAHPPDFQTRILDAYQQRLERCDVELPTNEETYAERACCT